jgi:hypothetical protein
MCSTEFWQFCFLLSTKSSKTSLRKANGPTWRLTSRFIVAFDNISHFKTTHYSIASSKSIERPWLTWRKISLCSTRTSAGRHMLYHRCHMPRYHNLLLDASHRRTLCTLTTHRRRRHWQKTRTLQTCRQAMGTQLWHLRLGLVRRHRFRHHR